MNVESRKVFARLNKNFTNVSAIGMSILGKRPDGNAQAERKAD